MSDAGAKAAFGRLGDFEGGAFIERSAVFSDLHPADGLEARADES